MYDKKLKYKILSIFAATVMTFTAITPVWAEEENLEADASGETSSDTSEKNAAPEIAGLTYESAMDLSFAECFDVYYYNDGYKLLDIHDDARYLIVQRAKRHPMIWILKSRSFSSHLTPSTWQPLPRWHCSMQSEV